MIVKNFSAGATRTGIGHLPKIVRGVACTLVVTNAHNTFGRYADFVLPDAIGLVVFLIDRYPKLVFWQRIDFSQHGPSKLDRITLEIIAKAKVAQHLKKRVVTGCVTHIF